MFPKLIVPSRVLCSSSSRWTRCSNPQSWCFHRGAASVSELDLFRQSRTSAVDSAKPSTSGHGWHACGDESTECWVRTTWTQPWTTTVHISTCLTLPIVSIGHRGLEGTLPVFCELERWPEWFPFCVGSNLIQEWPDGSELWHVKAQVAAFSLDLCILAKLEDCLAQSGYVDFVLTSPPAEAKSMCGVQLPERAWGVVRAELYKMVIRLFPLSLTSSKVEVVSGGVEHIPFEAIIRMVWSALSTQVAPLIDAQQESWHKRGFFEQVHNKKGAKYQQLQINIKQHLQRESKS
mmetsp:Transcript_105004/g.197799  ORF Transcript_105004/g.197799 Transcript_105004/m.197799 type:complete len:291 (+) Transcript_105004:53-925(+)